jgi:hypothetical protein
MNPAEIQKKYPDHIDAPHVVYLASEPGDGTRYELVVTLIAEGLETGGALGSTGGPSALIIDVMHRRACLMPQGEIDTFEFAEHLDIGNPITIYQFGRALATVGVRLHDLAAQGAALRQSGYRGHIDAEHGGEAVPT